MPAWRQAPPEPEAWRAPAGLTPAQRAAEQDQAAGGRQHRQLTLPDGRIVTASIALRHPPKSRRVYAYLRWSVSTRTHERYVTDVTEPTREANLRQAWRQAQERGLLHDEHGP